MLGGIRRTKGAKPIQKAPATAERITAMLEGIPTTLRGTRDRALLTLGFAGAFRRSELVALEAADLAFEPDGLRVQIRHSKPIRKGRGTRLRCRTAHGCCRCGRSRRGSPRPGIVDGRLFRGIDRHGRLGARWRRSRWR